MSKNSSSPTGYALLVKELLKGFPERSREIILSRFGIAGHAEKTLEEIGRNYHITRERVRQVIDVVLKNMKQHVAEKKDHPLIQDVYTELHSHGGIIPTDTLLDTLAGESKAERGALTVILHSLPEIKVLKETKEHSECLVTSDFSLSDWNKVIHKTTEILSEKEEVFSISELTHLVNARLGNDEILPQQLENFLAPSETIQKNVFGRWGLSHWSTVRPRGTRERAHLILKMLEKPLHFREIARLIDEHGLYRVGKDTHPQTVHNELIKDERFVLVGRGTYALSDWGYKRGTVREVLVEILKEYSKPMTREELLQAVMKVRQVKKSTVIINLNTFFTKVGKNIYTLKGE